MLYRKCDNKRGQNHRDNIKVWLWATKESKNLAINFSYPFPILNLKCGRVGCRNDQV